MVEEVEVNFLDPKFVRLASYLAAAGKTWRDFESKQLKTIIRGRFLSVVYPLFREFFPKSKCFILGSRKSENKPEHVTFRIDDSEILEMLESGGFKLGSKHRKPPPYIVCHQDLFKVYLRVMWEVHGRVPSTDPLKISLEQKYPQELTELKTWLNCSDIACTLINEENKYSLYITDPDAINKFFELFAWTPDGEFGRQKIDIVSKHLKQD